MLGKNDGDPTTSRDRVQVNKSFLLKHEITLNPELTNGNLEMKALN